MAATRGCMLCQDPLAVTVPAHQVRLASPNVAIFRCPGCGGLILDDAVGWKGSGVTAHVTEEEIEAYLREGVLPPRR